MHKSTMAAIHILENIAFFIEILIFYYLSETDM